MLRDFARLFILIGLLGFFSVPTLRADTRTILPTPQTSATSLPEDLQAQLKAAVLNSAAQIPAMDPIQKRIFDEEVVPQYKLFIRDYKMTGQKIDAQVDLPGIKNIIGFSTQKSLNQPGAKILLYLSVDAQCPKCVAESSVIRKMMVDHVERRGFTAVWVTNEELAGQSLADLTTPHGAVGFMRVDLGRAPSDDEDASHEEENRFLSKARLLVHATTDYHDQAEFYDTDTFQAETQKLLTHAFTDLGSKAEMAAVTTTPKDDLLIELDGIKNYPQYHRIKIAIEMKLKDVAFLEERKLSRGKAVFALKSRSSAQDVKTLLKDVLTGEDHSIQMEVR